MFCCYSVANSSLTLCNPMHCSMPGSRPSPSPRVCLDSCQLSWWCHSTILSSVTRFLFLPSNFPNIKVFSKESAVCIRWPKTWSFSFSIGPSNEYSGLISFRIDSFDLLAVLGTLKSFIQDHSLKSISSSVLSLLNHDSKYNLYLIRKTQAPSWSSRNVSQESWGRCPTRGFFSFVWKKQDPCVKLHSHQKETVLVEGMEVHHSDLLSKEAVPAGNTVASQPLEATLLNPLQLVRPCFPWAALLQGPGTTGLLEVGHSAWPGAPLKGNLCSGPHQLELRLSLNWSQVFPTQSSGFPGGSSDKEHACQYRRCKRRGFDPWVWKIP